MVEITKSFTLSETPVFVKAGSIIPMRADNFGQLSKKCYDLCNTSAMKRITKIQKLNKNLRKY